MFEEIQALSAERDLIARLFRSDTVEAVFHHLQSSIQQLVSIEGLCIRYYFEGTLFEHCTGSRSDEARQQALAGKEPNYTARTYPPKELAVSFGDDRGGRGDIYIIAKQGLTATAQCSIARMAECASEILIRIEALEQARRYAQERELLLRELRHRTKNNLQFMMNSLSSLLPGSEEINAYQRTVIEQRLQALIMLSSIWDTQAVDQYVNALSYFSTVSSTLQNLWLDGIGELVTRLDIPEDIVLTQRIATSIALIFNELITNTVKHGGDGSPKIFTSIRYEQNNLSFDYFSGILSSSLLEGQPCYRTDTSKSTGGQGNSIITGLLECSV
ncbi:MAG: hypothetical protein SNJ56_03685, partial [Termitinemataceae bacterium]